MPARPVTPPPRPPEPSGRAKPEITFQRERFVDFARAGHALFSVHWKEIALHQDKIALDPDWEGYAAFESQGRLLVWTAREGETLVGYILFLLTTGLHYRTTLYALSDIFYIDEAWREGWTGVRLFKTAFAELKRIGVQVVQVNVKDHFQRDPKTGRSRVGVFLERVLKMKRIETRYDLWIGD